MKLPLALLFLIGGLLRAEPDSPELEKHPIEIELEQAFEKESSTAGMVLAMATAQEKWNTVLDTNYQKLLKGLETEAAKALRESQSLWVAQRDKEVDFLIAFYSKMKGSMYRIIYADRMLTIVEERAKHLGYLVESLELREK